MQAVTASTAAQQKAQQLLQLADAVEQASQNKRQQLEQIQQQSLGTLMSTSSDEEEQGLSMNGNNGVEEESIDPSDDVHRPSSRRVQAATTTSADSLTCSNHSTSHEEHDDPTATDSSTLQNAPTNSSVLMKQQRKSIQALREQLRSSHQALVTMQENASLKLQKVQLEHQSVQASLLTVTEERNTSQATVRNLGLEIESLQRKLNSALGVNRVEWLIELETDQCRLLGKLDHLVQEKTLVVKERDELRGIVQACPTCRTKVSSYRPPPTPPPTLKQQRPPAQSFWKTLLHLNEEEVVEASPASPTATSALPRPPVRTDGRPRHTVSIGDTPTGPRVSSKEIPRVDLSSQKKQNNKAATTANTTLSSFLGAFTTGLSTESATAFDVQEQQCPPSMHQYYPQKTDTVVHDSTASREQSRRTIQADVEAEVEEMKLKLEQDMDDMRKEWSKKPTPRTPNGSFRRSPNSSFRKSPSNKSFRTSPRSPDRRAIFQQRSLSAKDTAQYLRHSFRSKLAMLETEELRGVGHDDRKQTLQSRGRKSLSSMGKVNTEAKGLGG